MLRALLPAFVAVLLTGCGGMKIDDFANTEPKLVLEDYFEGSTRAWGLFEDRFGNVRRQFVVDIEGDWDGETLTLVEDFVYNDGETERRVWTLNKVDDRTYVGSAEGVAGQARGVIAGNAFNWEYDFDLPVGDSTWRVHFDDWMFLQGDGVLINKATVSKFGITLGEVSLFFRKQGAAAAVDHSTDRTAGRDRPPFLAAAQ